MQNSGFDGHKIWSRPHATGYQLPHSVFSASKYSHDQAEDNAFAKNKHPLIKFARDYEERPWMILYLSIFQHE